MEEKRKSFGRRKKGQLQTSDRSRPKAAAPRDAAMILASMPISYVWFSFNMRINRKVFWLKGFLLLVLVQWAFQLVFLAINFALAAVLDPEEIVLIISAVILGVPYVVFVIWADLAVNVKRCHDRDRSGWFLLIALIPIVGWIWLIVDLWFLKGTSGENRFGADPLTAGA